MNRLFLATAAAALLAAGGVSAQTAPTNSEKDCKAGQECPKDTGSGSSSSTDNSSTTGSGGNQGGSGGAGAGGAGGAGSGGAGGGSGGSGSGSGTN